MDCEIVTGVVTLSDTDPVQSVSEITILGTDNVLESDTDEGNQVGLRGKPKSGRVWKNVKGQRHTAMKKDKKLHSTWEKKVMLKNGGKIVNDLKSEIRMARTAALDEKRRKTEEKRKRKEENERKSEIVQVIKNSAKIKRLKKKQLRKIEKRDTNPSTPS